MTAFAVNSPQEARALLELPLTVLQAQATVLREAAFGSSVALCAIINARSGQCGMDCSFCAQSRRSRVPVKTYALLPSAELERRILALAAAPVARIGLVTSGGALADDDVQRLAAVLHGLPQAVRGRVCTSLGRLQSPQLQALRQAGLLRYHHNLECSRSFYPQVCSTQKWDDRRDTLCHARKQGLSVCCGGLFGLGESWDDRIEFAFSLKELGVDNVPLNFLHPHPQTPLGTRQPLGAEEALRIIALFRHILPQATLRICGGRVETFARREEEIFASGANALMTGDFLTTCGQGLEHDLALLDRLGLQIQEKA